MGFLESLYRRKPNCHSHYPFGRGFSLDGPYPIYQRLAATEKLPEENGQVIIRPSHRFLDSRVTILETRVPQSAQTSGGRLLLWLPTKGIAANPEIYHYHLNLPARIDLDSENLLKNILKETLQNDLNHPILDFIFPQGLRDQLSDLSWKKIRKSIEYQVELMISPDYLIWQTDEHDLLFRLDEDGIEVNANVYGGRSTDTKGVWQGKFRSHFKSRTPFIELIPASIRLKETVLHLIAGLQFSNRLYLDFNLLNNQAVAAISQRKPITLLEKNIREMVDPYIRLELQ